MSTITRLSLICVISSGLAYGYVLGDDGPSLTTPFVWSTDLAHGKMHIMNLKYYENREYGFHIKYPDNYEVSEEEPTSTSSTMLRPLDKISFRERVHYRRTTRDLGPPEFTIRIFEKELQLTLDEWLRGNKLVPTSSDWHTEPYTKNDISGMRVYSDNFIAPGIIIYITSEKYVFELTPLGPEADRMLKTFTLLNVGGG